MRKQKKIALIILIILAISYIFLLFKLVSGEELICTLTTTGDNFEKTNVIVVKHEKKHIGEMVFKESFSSSEPKLLTIKKEELLDQKYQVKTTDKVVKGTKIQKVDKKYEETVKELTRSGYTCK